MSDPDDRDDLLLWANQHDEESLARLCRRYAVVIRQSCVRLGSPDPDDATQTVFLILARKGGCVHPHLLVAWLLTTARRTVSCQKRAAERRRRHELDGARAAAAGATSDTSAGSELLPFLDEALQSLTAKSREAIIRFYLMGEPQSLIAQAVGCSESAVKMRVHDGLKAMRRAFARRGVMCSPGLVIAELNMQRHAALAQAPPPDVVVAACLHPTAATSALAQAAAATAFSTFSAFTTLAILTGASMLLLATIVISVSFTAVQTPAAPPPLVVTEAVDSLAPFLDRHVDLEIDELPVATAVKLLVARSRLPIFVGTAPSSIPDEPPSQSYVEPQPLVRLAMHDQPVRLVLDRMATSLGWHWEQRRNAVALVPPVSDAQRSDWIAVLRDASQPYWRRKTAFLAGWKSGDTVSMEAVLNEALLAKLAGLNSLISGNISWNTEVEASDIYTDQVPEDASMGLLRILRGSPDDHVYMQGLITTYLDELSPAISVDQTAVFQSIVAKWKSRHPGVAPEGSGGLRTKGGSETIGAFLGWRELMRHYRGQDLDELLPSILALSKENSSVVLMNIGYRSAPQIVPALMQLMQADMGQPPATDQQDGTRGMATAHLVLPCLLRSAPTDDPELQQTVLRLVALPWFNLQGFMVDLGFERHPRLSLAILQCQDANPELRLSILNRIDRPDDLTPIWRLAEVDGNPAQPARDRLAETARNRLVAWGLGDEVRQRIPQPQAPRDKAAWCVMLAQGGTAALRQPLLKVLGDPQEPWESFQNVAWLGVTDPVITRELIQIATNDNLEAYRRRDACWQLGGTVPETQAMTEEKAQREPNDIVREGYIMSLPRCSPRAWGIIRREVNTGSTPIIRRRAIDALADGWPGLQSTHDQLRQLVHTQAPIPVRLGAARALLRIERSWHDGREFRFSVEDENSWDTLIRSSFQKTTIPQPLFGRSDRYDWLVTNQTQDGAWVVVIYRDSNLIRALWKTDSWSTEDGIRLLAPCPDTLRTPEKKGWYPDTLLIDLREKQAPQIIGLDDGENPTSIELVEQPDPAYIALAGRLALLTGIPTLEGLMPDPAAVSPQGADNF